MGSNDLMKKLNPYHVANIQCNWHQELNDYQANFDRGPIEKITTDDRIKQGMLELPNGDDKALYFKYLTPDVRNDRGTVDPDKMPILSGIEHLVGLADSRLIIMRYLPGNHNVSHYDKNPGYDLRDPFREVNDDLNEFCNPQFVRIVILLKDRSPGQFMNIGDHVINHWQAGDVFEWYALKDFHGACNVGSDTRWALRITGIDTPAYQEFKKTGQHYVR